MSSDSELKKQYDAMRFEPIGIVFPTIKGFKKKCLAYEVYRHTGEWKGISMISFDLDYIKPTGKRFEGWYKLYPEYDGYYFKYTKENGQVGTVGVISRVITLLESVVIETEILGCDLKLD